MSLANQEKRVQALFDDTYYNEKLPNNVRVRFDERPFDTLPKPGEVFVQVAIGGLDSSLPFQVDITERVQWTITAAARERPDLIRVLDIVINRISERRRPFLMDEVVYSDTGVYAVQVQLG